MLLIQFLKKFLLLPFSSLFIRQGVSLNFGVFYAIFGAFFPTCISRYFIIVYAAYSVSEEIFNAFFSPRSPPKTPTLYSGPVG